MQYKVGWDDLTEDQKVRAAENYQAIREAEEESSCDFNRAQENAPYCNGFWLKTDDPNYLEVEI